MPEELQRLTPPWRIPRLGEFWGVIVPLQGDLEQIRQSYRKHGVNLQFAADYVERRRKSARKAKQLGLDARPYMLRYWCGKCQADLITQFGETPICLSCASVPSTRELRKIFSFEGIVARSLRRDVPRNHADLVQEIYMTLPWHVPVESDEKPSSPWLLEGSLKRGEVRTRAVTLTFGMRVLPNKARRVFLHEVGHIFTTGDEERIKKDPTHILRQELGKFNAYASRKSAVVIPPELLADAYSLYATNEFPKRRFPRLQVGNFTLVVDISACLGGVYVHTTQSNRLNSKRNPEDRGCIVIRMGYVEDIPAALACACRRRGSLFLSITRLRCRGTSTIFSPWCWGYSQYSIFGPQLQASTCKEHSVLLDAQGMILRVALSTTRRP
jgi:hypothetical protein